MSEGIAGSVVAVCEAVLDLVEGPRQKKARSIAKQQPTLARVLRARWKAQRAILDGAPGKHLRALFDRQSEAEETDEEKRRKLLLLVAAALAMAWKAAGAGYIDPEDEDTWNAATAATMIASAKKLASDLGAVSTMDSTSEAVDRFMASHAFDKVAELLDQTTMDRISTALADSIETGEDFNAASAAVRDVFTGFEESRLLAVTAFELNAAYNAGRLEEARELGIATKWWNPDGVCCDVCQENADAGEVPLTDEFPTGADAPPEHPHCDCVLMVGEQ